MTTAAAAATFGNTEMLQIADAVAREKSIDRSSVLEAMEQAIAVAGRRKYGHEHDIRAEIDPKSGEIKLYRVLEVVETVDEEHEHTQVTPADAKRKFGRDAAPGEQIRDPLPPIDFGRIAAQTAKQVIVQKVRDAERDKQFEEYKDRVGEVINGTVKRVEYGNVTVDLGRAEGFIRRDQLIPGETYRQNDRIRAYIADVRREKSGPQILLSRTHGGFLVKLFAQEVPEIYDGIIEIKAVARDPGSRAKIGVISHDSNIDPVGSCVGVRGSRVQAVVGELQGEKIDIIPWSPDPATFIVNALAPAEISKVVIVEEAHKVEVVVAEDQLSLAIGRRGQNVRLASQLSGWTIDLLSEDDDSARRAAEFQKLTAMFTDALNVEEVLAQLLASEGFTTMEEVAYVPVDDLISVEGFDENVAAELQQRARDWLAAQEEKVTVEMKELGITDDLKVFAKSHDISQDLLLTLARGGVKTLDDLADLARDEFRELAPECGMKDDAIDALIMQAREHWFAGDEKSDER